MENQSIANLAGSVGIEPWTYASLVFFISMLVLFLVKRVVWKRLDKWSETTSSTLDDFLLKHLSRPADILILVISLGLAGQSLPPSFREHPLFRHGSKIGLIIVAVWILQRMFSAFMHSKLLPQKLTTPTRNLLLNIGRTIIYGVTLLVILDTIGISITPILASLGVGSVAIALALQDTLSNFFGGLYVLVDRPIRVGDVVEIDSIQGAVQQIGWRSTRILIGTNNIVVVPNTQVASAKLKNFDLPQPEQVVTVNVGVDYTSDLVHVEKVVFEVARTIQQTVLGAVKNFEPVIRYGNFGESSIDFGVTLRVLTFGDVGLVKHEFIKALHTRFNKEGISIPFPHRVLQMVPPSGQPGHNA